MHDTPASARIPSGRASRAGMDPLRGFLPPLAPALQADFDVQIEHDIARLLPVLGPISGLFVILFWTWDAWIDPAHADTALRIRVAMVVLGALAYAQGRLRWSPSWRCAWLYATHAGAIAVCAALPPLGLALALALPSMTGAMFVLALVEPRPRYFLRDVLPTSALVLLLAILRLPSPLSLNTMLLYALSVPLALGVALANLALRRRAFLAEHTLLHAVRHDSLSGALSRGYLSELAMHDIALARRHRRPLAVAMLDIDWFKKVNDTFGHACGDRALCALVRICRSRLRDSDYVGRIGGEEFVCVMPETGAADALACAERIRNDVSALALRTPSGPLRFTVSIGVAVLGSGQADWDTLLRAADAALYEAKAAGRNCTLLAGCRGNWWAKQASK